MTAATARLLIFGPLEVNAHDSNSRAEMGINAAKYPERHFKGSFCCRVQNSQPLEKGGIALLQRNFFDFFESFISE